MKIKLYSIIAFFTNYPQEIFSLINQKACAIFPFVHGLSFLGSLDFITFINIVSFVVGAILCTSILYIYLVYAPVSIYFFNLSFSVSPMTKFIYYSFLVFVVINSKLVLNSGVFNLPLEIEPNLFENVDNTLAKAKSLQNQTPTPTSSLPKVYLLFIGGAAVALLGYIVSR